MSGRFTWMQIEGRMKSKCGMRRMIRSSFSECGMGNLPPSAGCGDRREGAALIIVLAFIVLLTGLIIAFFSRSVLDRQMSNSSVSRAKVSAFADGAADAIIGELKQEIVLSSSATTLASGTIYTPLTPAAMLPQISGTSGIASLAPNVLKISGAGQLFYSGTNSSGTVVTIPSSGNNVVAVSSTTPSLNGRYFTPAYWNEHYLLPLLTSTYDSTPLPASFTPPSWVLVARDGSNPTTFNSSMLASGGNPVVGRYAFAIYHEGGLLDVNVAGYPSTTNTSQSAYKPALAYADLTQLPGGLTTTLVDKLVAWRNFASIPAPGSSFLTPGFTASSGSNYYNMVLSSTTGFLSVSGTAVNPNSNQTDQIFSSRQELIKFMQNGLGLSSTSLDVLNYLTTFSRDINQPSYIPPVQSSTSAPVVLAANLGGNSAYYQSPGYADKFFNPSFPTIRVTGPFTRNDGSTANVGDPLVNKRFALQRLAWITYKGPSASRPQGDPDIQALINDGIPWPYLQQGTTANIRNYFGLAWSGSNWNYVAAGTNSSGGNIIMYVGRPAGTAANSQEYVEDANRDPDFFELLKAGIAVGSLGKAAATSNASVSQSNTPTGYSYTQVPVNERYAFDNSVDYHIIQIGANILNEVNPTSYPVRITFNDGSPRGAWEFQGVTDLPYLNYIFNGVLRTQLPKPGPQSWSVDSNPFQYPYATTGATLTGSGNADIIQVPAVWNPYDPNGTIPPSTLRPSQFRIVVDSNDPVSLSGSGSSSDLPIWSGGRASTTTSGQGSDNSGVVPPSNTVYSWGSAAVPASGTAVSDSVTFTDGTGALYREPTLIFSTAAPGGATRTAGNIICTDSNALPGETDNSFGPWAPLVLGQFPLAFLSGSATTSGTICYSGIGLIGLAAGNGDNRVYFTYRVQYQDPTNASNWITYDTKYGRTTYGLFSFQSRGNWSPCVLYGPCAPANFSPYAWASAIDPRTGRFGLITDTMNQGRSLLPFPALGPAATGTTSWIYNSSGATQTVGITYPIRQDNSEGFYFVNLDTSNTAPGGRSGAGNDGLLAIPSTMDIPYPSFSAGWTAAAMTINNHAVSDILMFAPGMYAQNNPNTPFDEPGMGLVQPSYYADADGVVRRAAGAYVAFGGTASASTTLGLPPASIQGYPGAPQTAASTTPATTTPFTQSQSRPLLLHRPFRTVAELGYVFRDMPWKNLDFFAPESADAGLLDLFCINETASPTSLVAGKVNLNTRQAPVLTAIISGACVDDPKITNATVGSVSTIRGKHDCKRPRGAHFGHKVRPSSKRLRVGRQMAGGGCHHVRDDLCTE